MGTYRTLPVQSGVAAVCGASARLVHNSPRGKLICANVCKFIPTCQSSNIRNHVVKWNCAPEQRLWSLAHVGGEHWGAGPSESGEECCTHSSVFVRNFCSSNSIRRSYRAFLCAPRDAAAGHFHIQINYSDGAPINISALKGRREAHPRGFREPRVLNLDPLLHARGYSVWSITWHTALWGALF